MPEERASTAEVEAFMKGINLPAKKQDLINHAKRSNAPDNVIAVLSRMPDRDYTTAADVAQGVGQIE